MPERQTRCPMMRLLIRVAMTAVDSRSTSLAILSDYSDLAESTSPSLVNRLLFGH